MNYYRNISELSTINFAEYLEEKGFLALGEPFVDYQLRKGKELINIYLTYETHGIQCGLLNTHFISERKPLDIIFTSSEEKKNTVFTLTDFINQYNERKVHVEKTFNLNNEALLVGKESQKKQLTLFAALNILGQDILSPSYNQHNNVDDMRRIKNEHFIQEKATASEIIRSCSNTLGKPEQLAYLTRIKSLCNEDIEEYLSYPVEWLSKSLFPEYGYTHITLPDFNKQDDSFRARRISSI